MAATLSADQEQATRDFLEVVNKLRRRRHAGPVSWAAAVKFLTARKFDVGRAVTLYEAHEATRHREGLSQFNPLQEPLSTELRTGKFTVLPARDESGAAIAIFTASLHDPNTTSHQCTLQGVVYQLDVALESAETQRCGLVFIYDMTGSKYSHFDYELSQKILTLLKGGYPARLKKVLIVTAPLWFKAPFKILRLFVREKLRDRVYTVSVPQLTAHIPRHALPRSLGGSLAVDHAAWLRHCFKSMTNRHDNDLAPATQATLDLANNLGERMGSPAGGAVSELDQQHTVPSMTVKNGQVDNEDDVVLDEITPRDLHNGNDSCWNGSSAEAPSSPAPHASSSASSGFSDDDSLHGGADDSRGQDLEQFVQMVQSKGRTGLRLEYAEIRSKPPDGTFNNAKQRNNLSKNRYTDVLCFDHSRVVLTPSDPNDATSDYINANFVDGYKQKNAFISTQGPLPKTFEDFWRMVWEQHVLVVVMTTRVIERGRTKCGQYWPAEQGGKDTHGEYEVVTESVEQLGDYTRSKIVITNLKTEESRVLCHFQFLAWPDYGVPDTATAMLSFLNTVRNEQSKMVADLGDTWAGHSRGPPIIVHCSAGIGRTGTFCTLDICISRLEDAGSVDVRGTVEKIRSQRGYSIQMPDQYVFCHLALLEHAISKNLISGIDLSEFHDPPSSDSD
ncbi:tyrosine-protein phosphatase non-receptor type 9 [Cloeon dipterum]|uniref:tyrosine-protein phosphatase non-receptor type 9 n=1 Tax=Cloeon dipterum TaxID=197152 RepID=UPI0032200676